DSPAIQWYPLFFTLVVERDHKLKRQFLLNTEPISRFASSKNYSPSTNVFVSILPSTTENKVHVWPNKLLVKREGTRLN
uniref:Uncharacterized protein n=1 Tax=Anopheles dirus TaxID=7168 RepID=A0A182NYW5_9DIPT